MAARRRAKGEQARIGAVLRLPRYFTVSLWIYLLQRCDPEIQPVRIPGVSARRGHAVVPVGQSSRTSRAVRLRTVLRGAFQSPHGPLQHLPPLHRGGSHGCTGVRTRDHGDAVRDGRGDRRAGVLLGLAYGR